MGVLLELPNIGKALEEQLNSVGIYNAEALKDVGSKEAWIRIKAMDTTACYNRLCALEGAIQGVRWHMLSEDIKADLKKFYTENK